MRLLTTATQVDFYPVGTGKRFVQRTTWHPGAESEMITYSTIVKSEMIYKVNNYIANGATVLATATATVTVLVDGESSPLQCVPSVTVATSQWGDIQLWAVDFIENSDDFDQVLASTKP